MKLKRVLTTMPSDKISVVSNRCQNEVSSKAADFETALAATGFGRFNLIILIIAVPATAAAIFETTTMSYVFPAAQCDLELTMQNKGMLNAATYLGMIISAMLWGFLADTLGRKKLLVVGYFLDAIFVMCSGFSQSFEMLITFKFLGGFIVNGPFAALTAYLSELHTAKYRARVMFLFGILNCLANIIMPLLAWLVLPINLEIPLFNNYKLYSWNVYLLLCALPSCLGCFSMIFMPESPKFLMTTGRNKEALDIFRMVYSINTGRPKSDYPVKILVDEIEMNNSNVHSGHVTANRTTKQAVKEGWQQIKPLFLAPYCWKAVLVCLIQGGIITGVNSLRLWLPQIFVAITNYQTAHNNTSADLCEMLQMVQANITKVDGSSACEVDVTQDDVYINSIIVAAVAVAGNFLAGTCVNKLGKKLLLVLSCAFSAGCSIGMYFSKGAPTVVALSSVFGAAGSVSANILIAVVVDLFPTTLRTITVSLIMMFGRSGALIGNVLFPIILQAGCIYPFVAIGSLFIMCILFSLLLPKTDLKALE